MSYFEEARKAFKDKQWRDLALKIAPKLIDELESV
jgi:hypothetical protein